MVQKIMVNVNCGKPLNSYGDGHILVYDKDSNCYFPATRESFLQPQNDKIKELEKKFSNLETSFNENTLKTREKFGDFVKKYEEDYNSFLANYKESNAKIIAMVKSLIEEEDK